MKVQNWHGVLLVGAVAVLSFSLGWPVGWTAEHPLPWDESSHYQGAVEISQALADGDAGALRRALLDVDQYPPGHPVVLGLWMACFGNDVASWLSFGLLVHVLTAVLLASLHPAAGLLFVGLGMFGGLAPSLMVEPLAVLWVVLAIRLLPERFCRQPDWWRFAGAWAAVGLAVFTKYNFGLPLVLAVGAGAVVRGGRRVVWATVAAAAIVLLGWAAYLTAQESGWEMFGAFARNRANSDGLSLIGRLEWYSQAFVDQWTGSTWIAVGIAVTAAVSLGFGHVHRSRRAIASVVLVVATLGAICLHPYLLGRNLVVVVAGVVLLIGSAWSDAAWRGSSLLGHAMLIVLAASVLPLAGSVRARNAEVWFPDEAGMLAPVSEVVVRELGGGGLVRVVGTWDRFGAGWVRLLQMKEAPATTLGVDVPYPLERGRDALDTSWDPVYATIVDGWAVDGTRAVVSLEVSSSSPVRSEDYERWNLWKVNLVQALEEDDRFEVRSDEKFSEAGVRVRVFDRVPDGLAKQED